MRLTTLLRRLLGVTQMYVKQVEMAADGPLTVSVEPSWRRSRCGTCGKRPLGPPRGSASAALDAAPRGVAAHRTRAGRARWIAHPLRRAHLLPGRHGPLRLVGSIAHRQAA